MSAEVTASVASAASAKVDTCVYNDDDYSLRITYDIHSFQLDTLSDL